LKTDVVVPSKRNTQKKLKKTKNIFDSILKARLLKKRTGSGSKSESGSFSQWYGSANPGYRMFIPVPGSGSFSHPGSGSITLATNISRIA
jgi:hypothetical protein